MTYWKVIHLARNWALRKVGTRFVQPKLLVRSRIADSSSGTWQARAPNVSRSIAITVAGCKLKGLEAVGLNEPHA
jgi:hypothetical protein